MIKITKATKDAPYPYNLIHDIFYQDLPLKKLAPDMDQSLEHALSTMPEREAEIVQLRYKDGQTIKEIAKQYHVTAERIHQLIRRSLRLLRHPSRSRYLLYGYQAVTQADAAKEEQERLRVQHQEEQIRSFLQPDRFVGPLSEMPDAHDRADAILARGQLNRVYEIGISSQVHRILNYAAGIEYAWQLCFVQPHELLQLHGIGPKQAVLVEQCLADYQLALDDGTLSAAPELWDYLEQRSEELERIIQETSQETE